MKRISVAKKSGGKYNISNSFVPKPLVPHITRDNVEGNMLVNRLKPIKFRPHQCTNHCLSLTDYNPNEWKNNNPLAIPFMYAFHRLICRLHNKRAVVYVTPCGQRLYSYSELHHYLRLTECLLTVDMFDFDFSVSCTNEFHLGHTLTYVKDISYGKENIPISCVNDIDKNYSLHFHYIAERKLSEGVHINLDKNFLIGCDCTDDCQNQEKCCCWQLTYAGAKYNNFSQPDNPIIGYQYRRLADRVNTGIYECNPQCKCASTCLNRVAQNPLTTRLQLFKTRQKGWGVRTLHDIPRGAFICVYTGIVLTKQAAYERGKRYGDEYLAELDCIEIVERLKEDYESFVSQELLEDSDEDSDEDFDDSSNDQSTSSQEHVPKYPSVRNMFGNNESIYIIDAKHCGNVGRCINHSCNPNIFGQNVFVDTHDLRFPWIAFFSKKYIRAGTELTWDYNYDVGSVPGRIIYCYCGSNNCRGRLL